MKGEEKTLITDAALDVYRHMREAKKRAKDLFDACKTAKEHDVDAMHILNQIEIAYAETEQTLDYMNLLDIAKAYIKGCECNE